MKVAWTLKAFVSKFGKQGGTERILMESDLPLSFRRSKRRHLVISDTNAKVASKFLRVSYHEARNCIVTLIVILIGIALIVLSITHVYGSISLQAIILRNRDLMDH